MALSFLLLAACRPAKPPVAPTPLRIGVAVQAPSALLFIALDRQYLQAEGLTVELAEFPSGRLALEALQAGRVDLITAAEVPLVAASFTQPDFRILATIATADNESRIVARRDRGITAVTDLRGKRIGTQKASAVHYFLYLTLARQGLAEAAVTLRFAQPDELPRLLAAGEIDAFVMREPFVTQAVELLGTNAVVLAQPGLYSRAEVLAVHDTFARAHPETLPRLLRALLRAESFAARQPVAAQAITAARLRLPPAALTNLWSDLDLAVNLDQTLYATMESEARWFASRGLVRATELPNFLPLVDRQPLTLVAPDRVTVIHGGSPARREP